MLKTHGDNKEKLPLPAEKCTVLQARSPEALSDYNGTDKGDLTIVGELNKLASNAALPPGPQLRRRPLPLGRRPGAGDR